MPRRSERIKSKGPVNEMAKRKRESVDLDSSDSSHSSVKGHQEDSWVPPSSYRKHFTANALMNSCRRASMRLARRLNEAVATCSESKLDKMMEKSTQRLVVKSRSEPSSTDCSPQRDVVALDPQAPANSPTTSLNQVAKPNTSSFTQAKRDENIKKIGYSNLPKRLAADMSENEVLGGEKSMSRCLTLIEGPDAYHQAASNPLHLNNFEPADCTLHASNISIGKHASIIEDIAASNIIEDQYDQCKSNLMVRHPSQCYSFTLTELANGVCYDEDSCYDEVDSSLDTVQGYRVKEEFVPTLRKIFEKYGDISRKFPLSRMDHRAQVLENVCKIVKTMEDREFSQLTEAEVTDMIDCVKDLGNVNMELDWLHQRLEEILEAKQFIKQSRVLKEERDQNRCNIALAEREREAFEAEKMALDKLIRDNNDKLAILREESNRIEKTITDAISKVQRCYKRPLVEGLF